MSVTADTSVIIPALASWHESHHIARTACRAVTRIPAHAMLEAISVLTRLPGGLALATRPAVEVVRAKFPDEPLALTGAQYTALTHSLVAAGLRGGQVYDALVAAAAAEHGATLLSLDNRAVPVYRALGVAHQMLG